MSHVPEVRARVGEADEDIRVADDLLERAPAVVGHYSVPAEPRAMLGDELEEDVDGVLAALASNIREGSADKALVGAGEDLALIEITVKYAGEELARPLAPEARPKGRGPPR